MILLLWVITFFYGGLILFLLLGFNKVEAPQESSSSGSIGFSIVIPFRNEAENLPGLFASLQKLEYPQSRFEILLVNDSSEDQSERLCSDFRDSFPDLMITVLQSERKTTSPKKDAVNTAVVISGFQYILTTDADCEVPEEWLQELDCFIKETGAEFIAGPVAIKEGEPGKINLLNKFQELDFLSLQGATIGGFGVEKPYMCNGANLCYKKASFEQVQGFNANDDIASGDDIFLLEKFEEAGFKTGYLKSTEAIVSTLPQPDLHSLTSQRIRWASKTSFYRNDFGKFVAVVVFLMNLSLVFGLIAVSTGILPKETFFLYFLVKFNVDFVIIYKTAVFFKKEKLMKNYFWSCLLYPFFSSYVALSSLFTGYYWKGRRFKK